MIESFPLQWPAGYPRTQNWKVATAKFGTSFSKARDAIIDEVRRFGGADPIISTNIPVRQDGFPYATYSKPKDPGVAIYFNFKKTQVVFACDRWDKIEDNLQAVRKTIEAMRGMERWGVSDMLNRVFSGFTAIPEKAASFPWWEVLGLSSNCTKDDIKPAYKRLVKIHHPQNGGEQHKFDELNEAYERALKQFS